MYSLRPPQLDVRKMISDAAIAGHKRILVCAPTGFGKTILAYSIHQGAISKKKRNLFTAHRIQLADQTFKKFSDLNPSYLQGNSDGYDHDNLLQVATLQTLTNREIEAPEIVIIDEVHYGYESSMVQQLFTKWPNAFFIGLSATPIDNQGNLLEGFDTIIDKYQTGDLIKLGWLVPFVVYSPVKPDLSEVKIVAGEYEESGVIEAIKKDDINASSVENYVKYGECRPFICFAVNQAHAYELQVEFDKVGVLTGVMISSTSAIERERMLLDLKRGVLNGLISVEILTAGFDEPLVSCVMLVCPTKSLRKFIQCAGRGIRLLGDSYEESVANGKSDCILLDCAGSIEEHGMPDERRTFKFKKRVSRVLDRENQLDTIDGKERLAALPEEKQIYLKKIGSLLDLYEGRVYTKEADLQEDINKFLEKTGYFWYRQNSGKAFIKDRWVHFTNKSGLPDDKIYYKNTSFSFWLELKLPKGRLTSHQEETLPEMTQNMVLFFIVENIMDAYLAIEHVETHLEQTENGLLIRNTIYDLSERQVALRTRLKLTTYERQY